MSDKTYKKVEIVGTSEKSFSEAVENGVKRASQTLRNCDWFEVAELRGAIDGDKVRQFQATLKIGFRLDG